MVLYKKQTLNSDIDLKFSDDLYQNLIEFMFSRSYRPVDLLI